MDSDEEAYILLVLSDGNLPTGSFVASGGLESYVTHGFFTPLPVPGETDGIVKDKAEYIVDFIRDSLATYARSALPFVSDAHRIVQQAISTDSSDSEEELLRGLVALDKLYETTTLNHITRRASTTQGVALLTLYSKGFSKPALRFASSSDRDTKSTDQGAVDSEKVTIIVDRLKLIVRREDTPGHLPVCWGVLTAALGLSLERSQFLHLFLFARGILSSAVRVNIIGPYAAQQVLLHAVRPVVTAEASNCAALRTGLRYPAPPDGEDVFEEDVLTECGPVMTWPLGEILAARHDLQHSRVFNS